MQLKTITQKSYDSPKVEAIELKVEQGFAASGIGINDDFYGGEEEW